MSVSFLLGWQLFILSFQQFLLTEYIYIYIFHVLLCIYIWHKEESTKKKKRRERERKRERKRKEKKRSKGGMTQSQSQGHPRVGPAPLCIDYPTQQPLCPEFTYTTDIIALMAPPRIAAKFSPCFRKYSWDPYAVLLTDHDLERVKKSYRRATAPPAIASSPTRQPPQQNPADMDINDSHHNHNIDHSPSRLPQLCQQQQQQQEQQQQEQQEQEQSLQQQHQQLKLQQQQQQEQQQLKQQSLQQQQQQQHQQQQQRLKRQSLQQHQHYHQHHHRRYHPYAQLHHGGGHQSRGVHHPSWHNRQPVTWRAMGPNQDSEFKSAGGRSAARGSSARFSR
ncbi:hypothetical protein, conserved [Trypanosoma brucei brucei TREU927]|uniref:Uncharacterized protein n=1 Tax=Trypanosoma brucei brucei (strain 927/4 GUTat10.1) TaxID=185431 RepID=Q57ZR8_TRYB2|nr:hypothetical protein, conserved [Trypanosoma brucei brucei TREU927]AAX79098.1 hypothetical protein, conserved [Trypanosoma brucei]AAZ11314.1 hypothetical protein, conserved [Trypanosoma brucei brucei TREU927]